LLPNGDFNVITNLFYEPSLSWMKDIRLGTKELLLVYTKEQILIFIAYISEIGFVIISSDRRMKPRI